jgi:putative toxin-antitoxin system antitoxin component (TIGR02293 family)
MVATARTKPRPQKSKSPLSVLLALDVGALVAEIHKGLPFAAFEELVERTGLPREALAKTIQVPMRTLARRSVEGRFRAEESDRLLRIARIVDQSANLFEGDLYAARNWLATKQLALNDATPMDYASTEVGAREVESLIGRLEQGIPS